MRVTSPVPHDNIRSILASNGFTEVNVHSKEAAQPKKRVADVVQHSQQQHPFPGKQPRLPGKQAYASLYRGKPRHISEYGGEELERLIASMGPKHEALLRRQYAECDMHASLRNVCEALDDRILEAEAHLNQLQAMRNDLRDVLERHDNQSSVSSGEGEEEEEEEEGGGSNE